MSNSVAVWTQRNKIRSRVDDVVGSKLGYGRCVVNLDQPCSRRPVPVRQFDPAHHAGVPVNREGRCPVPAVALIPVHLNLQP